MGQIANQMALELFFKMKQRLKGKREEKKQVKIKEKDIQQQEIRRR